MKFAVEGWSNDSADYTFGHPPEMACRHAGPKVRNVAWRLPSRTYNGRLAFAVHQKWP
jgi:hypothetical protein